ncbi:MAG: hypothetical protein R3C25_12545 [Hyphomonadaceae bacterium]
MRRIASFRLQFKGLAFTLLLAASALRGVLPSGYMPDLSAERGIVMQLCGAEAPHFVRLDLETGAYAELGDKAPDDEAPRKTAGEHCPFAAATVPAIAAPAPAAIAAPRAPALDAAPTVVTARLGQAQRTSFSARGPPLQA